MIRTTVRRACGHSDDSPTGVFAQSKARIRSAILSPLPRIGASSGMDSPVWLISLTSVYFFSLPDQGDRHGIEGWLSAKAAALPSCISVDGAETRQRPGESSVNLSDSHYMGAAEARQSEGGPNAWFAG